MPQILILDDRSTNRAIYTRLAMLIGEDVVVEAFSDPLDALEWLADNPVDLVVTDYRMPQIDGAEFIRRLRASRVGADVPVIVVTVYDDRTFRLRAMEAGATDFLQSPVDHVEFVTRARNLLALPRQAGLPAPCAHAEVRPAALPSLGLDDLPALISVADRVGRCLFVNARQASQAGAAPEQLIGQDIARVLGDDRAARSRARDREVFATGNDLPVYWDQEPTLDGPRWLLTSKAPLRDQDGAVIGVVSTSFELPPDGKPAGAGPCGAG
jgi:CheY-like chemotaxis protein